MAFLKDATFNVANWVFAFRYFTISRAMPFCLAGKPVPAEITKRDERTNIVFLTLNVLSPLLEGIAYLLGDLIETNFTYMFAVIAKCSVGVM